MSSSVGSRVGLGRFALGTQVHTSVDGSTRAVQLRGTAPTETEWSATRVLPSFIRLSTRRNHHAFTVGVHPRHSRQPRACEGAAVRRRASDSAPSPTWNSAMIGALFTRARDRQRRVRRPRFATGAALIDVRAGAHTSARGYGCAYRTHVTAERTRTPRPRLDPSSLVRQPANLWFDDTQYRNPHTAAWTTSRTSIRAVTARSPREPYRQGSASRQTAGPQPRL